MANNEQGRVFRKTFVLITNYGRCLVLITGGGGGGGGSLDYVIRGGGGRVLITVDDGGGGGGGGKNCQNIDYVICERPLGEWLVEDTLHFSHI